MSGTETVRHSSNCDQEQPPCGVCAASRTSHRDDVCPEKVDGDFNVYIPCLDTCRDTVHDVDMTTSRTVKVSIPAATFNIDIDAWCDEYGAPRSAAEVRADVKKHIEYTIREIINGLGVEAR